MSIMTGKGYRFFIKTLGCKVNQYESQAIRENMLKNGFKECLSKETADIYVINTCTVTHKADTESRHWASIFYKTNPKAKIVITGCSIQKDSGSFSFLPGISNIVKNEDKGRIAEILASPKSLPAGQAGVVGSPQTKEEKKHQFLSITDFKDHAKAFVKIQDGCDNLCSYCKVSSVRGPMISKPLQNVVGEIETLVLKGFKEIVLTGICLGAWGSDIRKDLSIVDVLKALDGIAGDFRVRLSSIEPKYVSDELIDHIAANRRFCRHLHIPIQSGDDAILAGMNRPYTAGQLRDLTIKVKKRIEGVGITTDILVGFPGESDKNFRNTVNLIKEILPVRTHIFPFSKRDGTAASLMEEQVPHDVVKNRLQSMNIAAVTVSYLYRDIFRNKYLDVLVESKRDKQSGRLTGYSDNYIKIMFEGPDTLMKNVVPVKIEELNLTYTLGSLAKTQVSS